MPTELTSFTPSTQPDAAPIVARFAARLRPRPWASADKESWRVVQREVAMGMANIEAQPPFLLSYLIFDVDRDTAAWDWLERDVPPPTLIISGANGRAHLWYELRVPVAKRNARAWRYYRAVYAALRAKLGADASFNRRKGKNPLCGTWQVRTPGDRLYALEELGAHLFEDVRELHRNVPRGTPPGRNAALFDLLRFHAYAELPRLTALGEVPLHRWERLLAQRVVDLEERAAELYPQLFRAGRLPRQEVRHIVRSVARWTHGKKFGARRVGVLRLGVDRSRVRKHARSETTCDPEETRRRQQLGARHVNAQRRAATEARVRDAVVALLAEGARLTLTAVARRAGIALRTLQRGYRAIVEATSAGVRSRMGKGVKALASAEAVASTPEAAASTRAALSRPATADTATPQRTRAALQTGVLAARVVANVTLRLQAPLPALAAAKLTVTRRGAQDRASTHRSAHPGAPSTPTRTLGTVAASLCTPQADQQPPREKRHARPEEGQGPHGRRHQPPDPMHAQPPAGLAERGLVDEPDHGSARTVTA